MDELCPIKYQACPILQAHTKSRVNLRFHSVGILPREEAVNTVHFRAGFAYFSVGLCVFDKKVAITKKKSFTCSLSHQEILL